MINDMINDTPEYEIQEKQNRNRCMSLIKSKIRLRRPGFDWDQEPALFEIYDYTLDTMQDPVRTLAVKNVLIDSPFQPDPADIRKEYARLIGTSSDETPEETITRHERVQEYRERLAREIEEKRRREFRPEMADPEYRHHYFAGRGYMGALAEGLNPVRVAAAGDNPPPGSRALARRTGRPLSPAAISGTLAPPPAQTDFQRRLLSCKTTEERQQLIDSVIRTLPAADPVRDSSNGAAGEEKQ